MEVSKLSRESREALTRLLEQPRIEIFPSKGVEEEFRHLPKETKVTVTCSPRRGIETTLLLSEQLSKQGLRSVPHISARLVADKGHLEKIFQSLADHNTREIFVIGGDAKEPVGPFPSSLALLSAMADSGYKLEQLGIAAYPEGHPLIDDITLLQALKDKQPFATYMVTQMCFDPEVIVNWIADIRQHGIQLPVYIGIPGVFDGKRLLKVALRIGIGESASFLKSHTSLVGRMVKPGYSPDHLVSSLAPYAADPSYNIQGFHIYTFNQVETTERWREGMLNQITESHLTL